MRHAFHKTMMTCHILIPVRIFFILGRHIMPSRESGTHVLKCLARTLLTDHLPSLIRHAHGEDIDHAARKRKLQDANIIVEDAHKHSAMPCTSLRLFRLHGCVVHAAEIHLRSLIGTRTYMRLLTNTIGLCLRNLNWANSLQHAHIVCRITTW